MTTITHDMTTYAVHHGDRVTVFAPLQGGVDVFLQTGPDQEIQLHCEHHHRRGCAHVRAARREVIKPDAKNRPSANGNE